jgi:hypothetical protein
VINLSRIVTGVIALGTITFTTLGLGIAHASVQADDDYAVVPISLTDPIWLTDPMWITDPLWVTDPLWITDPLWLTDPTWSTVIDWEATDLIILVPRDQRLPRGSEVIYRDRTGTTVAELETRRGRTLITIVQSDDDFDVAMAQVTDGRVDPSNTVLVVNPDSMFPKVGNAGGINPDSMRPGEDRVGSTPTPHP